MSLSREFIAEEKLVEKVLRVFCDGGARGNPGPAAVGFVVKDNKGRTLVKIGKYIGKTTNNVAEYQGVIEALKWLKKNFPISQFPNVQLNFLLDSKLIVNQLNGLYKIKNTRLRNLIVKVRILEREIKLPINYHYISRGKNKEADSLVNQVLNRHLD